MTALFELSDVRFGYGKKTVLDGLSLTLEPGRFYGIVGPNGSGKSTLCDLLVANRSPNTGTIRYLGVDITEYSRQRLSREIALVPQNFYINFPFTAGEIVMMGRYPRIPRFSAPSDEDLRQVRQAMDMTATALFTDRFITELSGGERQRVIWARALAQDTPVLIMDEATSNLDVNHAMALLNIASERVRQGRTVLTVLQDINLAAAFCGHLVMLKDGGVAVQGPTDRVLTSETLRWVFGVESKVYDEPFNGAKQVVFKR